MASIHSYQERLDEGERFFEDIDIVGNDEFDFVFGLAEEEEEETNETPDELVFKNCRFSNVGKMFQEVPISNKVKFIDCKIVDGSCSKMFMKSLFTEIDVSGLDTSNVKWMDNMFSDCEGLEKLTLGELNTSNVKSMKEMFAYCPNLESLDLHSFDTSKVKDMESMFHTCSKIKELDLSNFNTSNVRYMTEMFANCYELEKLDISSFDTSAVAFCREMFEDCSNLKNLDISHFKLVDDDFESMFGGCDYVKTFKMP